jgi:hypothetical protein
MAGHARNDLPVDSAAVLNIGTGHAASPSSTDAQCAVRVVG